MDSMPRALEVSIGSSPSSAESTFRELDDVFLQTQARIWLGEVLHTRLDEDVPIADLLADGKLLFQVSKVVWKMLLTKCVKLRYSKAYFSESMASVKSSGRYMPYSNVDSFLKICQTLGLTSIDLFSPSDVVENREIRRVCMCIRSFSKKARSKDLNVPDFDVVTYTVAMPTDMVGCIRRSLERSQDRYSKSSDCCSPCMDGKPRHRQRRWDVGYVKDYGSCSEESEDTGSYYRELGFDSPSSSTSYDDVSLLISDAENSPGGSLVVMENLISTHGTPQSVVQDHEKDGHNSSQCAPNSLAEVKCSPTLCLSNTNLQFPKVLPDCVSSPLLICETEATSFVNDGAARIAVSDPRNGIMGFTPVDLQRGTSASSVVDPVRNHNKSETDYTSYQSGVLDLIRHGTDNGESFYFYGGRKGGVSDSCTVAAFPGSNSIYKDMRYQLERKSSEKIEDVKAHFTASLNSISSKADTIGYEDKFEASADFFSPHILLTQVQDSDSVYKDMISVSGYEYEEMVKYGVSLDSSTGDTNKLLSDMKSEDIDSSKYLPTVECQMSTISEVVIPRCMCSTYICHPPITFSEDAQWASGANSNREDDVEVPFNVASLVLAIKEGEKCGNRVATRGSNLKQFNGKDIPHCNDVIRGNASEGIIVQQSFVKGHPTSCYGNSSSTNNSVQKALPQSDLDILEDKHVLTSSVNIQSTESGCLVLGHPKSHSSPLSVKNSVKDPVSEEQTCPPLSTNIQFAESAFLLPDHLVGESEKCQLNNGSAGSSVDCSSVLECVSVLDNNGRTLDKVCVSGPDHGVYHDEGDIMVLSLPTKGEERGKYHLSMPTIGDEHGIYHLSMPTKGDECGNPSTSFENDNEDNDYQHPVDKNVLHVTRQGFTDQEETTNCVGNEEKDNEKHEKVEKCFGASKGKSRKRVLLKSVAGGVTLVGVVFFLFNLRRKYGKENVDESSSLSIQVTKGNHAKQSKQNGQKQGRVHGIYPGNKLRFQG